MSIAGFRTGSPDIQGPLRIACTTVVNESDSGRPVLGSILLSQSDPQYSTWTGTPVRIAPPWVVTAVDGIPLSGGNTSIPAGLI